MLASTDAHNSLANIFLSTSWSMFVGSNMF